MRWYDKTRGFWLGGYLQAAVDMYTGLPLAISVFPADVAEWDGYPDLFRVMVAALGEAPRVVSVDRGFALRPFHEFNIRRGVAVVAPFRKRTKGEKLVDRRTDAFDEHGVPRCKFCGGPGDQTSRGFGLAFDSAGEPHIRFSCLLQLTHDCQKPQSIGCAEDWVQLLPLSRETELYHAVRHAHHNKEGLFQHDRRRYAVAGKEGLGRLCRSGIEAHRLRACAALLLNWFRISLRQGWLDPVELTVSRNTSEPVRLSGLADPDTGERLEPGIGAAALRKLELHREEHRLELPYGSSSARLRRAYQEIA